MKRREKRYLLKVAAASLGLAALDVACGGQEGPIGDIVNPVDATADVPFYGKLPIDAGPDRPDATSLPDVTVGAMPLDAAKD